MKKDQRKDQRKAKRDGEKITSDGIKFRKNIRGYKLAIRKSKANITPISIYKRKVSNLYYISFL